jgi:transcription elongation factor Elf1
MERLVFVCPTTGRDVDVGVETEIQTLLQVRGNTVHARCSACGQRHEWPVRDAFLAEAI